jgi:hypothetical protein
LSSSSLPWPDDDWEANQAVLAESEIEAFKRQMKEKEELEKAEELR